MTTAAAGPRSTRELPSLASLRRQVALMAEVRDRLRSEPADEEGRWREALVPLTDTLLRELAAAELGIYGRAPRPHITIWPTTEAS